MTKPKNFKLIVAGGVVVLLILLALFLFAGDNLDILKTILTEDLSDEQIRERVSHLGIGGYLFVTILSALQVIVPFLPSGPVQIVSGLSYGFWIGLLPCIVGIILGNSAIHLLYRTYGDSIRSFFCKRDEVDFSEVSNSKRVATLILALYFVPAVPYGMIAFLTATLDMRYRRYLAITTLGALPSCLITVALGHVALFYSWKTAIIICAVLLVLIIILLFNRTVLLKKLNDALKSSRKKSSSKKNVKTYNHHKLDLPYIIFRTLILGKIKFKFSRKIDKIERPAIVLCNHGAFIDFAYAGTLLKKESPNFVVARLYFYKKLTNNILRSFGCFPKSMFANDLDSAMNCLRVIRGGGVLAMMPEARLSTVGKFEDIQESTFSFLKKSGVHVYTIKICGDYLAKPKWGKGLRRGALVDAQLDLLFTPEELKKLTVAEIKEKTEAALNYDEFAWLEEHPELKYRSRHMAEGLENVITLCPHCNSRCSFTTKGNKMTCGECGLEVEINERYAFNEGAPFENFAVWYDWQIEQLREKFRNDENFKLSTKVELKHASRDGKHLLDLAGNGECTLTREGLTYVGTDFGENVERHFAAEEIYRLLFGAGEDFEIYDGKEIYYFTPEDRRECVDWYIASCILYEERTKEKETV